jgi:hypothetical protein
MFFCCDICAIEFKNTIQEVKDHTGWNSIDEIKMTGDYRGRDCIAIRNSEKYGFFIRFDSKGHVETFTVKIG